MATGGEEQGRYSLVNVGTVTLENANERPDYISIVICQDKLIVVYRRNVVGIYRQDDGRYLAMFSEYPVVAICLVDANTLCVLCPWGGIEMVSIQSIISSAGEREFGLRALRGVLDIYSSVVRVNDNYVVVGVKNGWLCWCIVLSDDENVDTDRQFNKICKTSDCRRCSVTTKGTIIYISCYAAPLDTGVYKFDILKPGEVIDKYKNEQSLKLPTSIVINEDNHIFVGNGGKDSCIHQITVSCRPVAIFTLGIPQYIEAMFWDNGRLYVTCKGSHDITAFRHVNKGSHKASDVLVSDERKQPGIDEAAIQIAQGNVDNGKSSVTTEMPSSGLSPKNSADEKKDSEVQISDEEKQPVFEGTSTQIGQAIPIKQSVQEELNQAGIKMSTEERDLFIKFQNEIGTDIYFSKGTHRLTDGQENLSATEIFIEKSHPDMKEKWLEYKSQGKLTLELINVIYAEERNPDLHANKTKFLKHMDNLNIIVKARSLDENGVKEDNYFFAPCILRLESPGEVVAPEQDPHLLSTSVLCWGFTGTFLPSAIFDGLLAACIGRWPVAKKKDGSKHLISHGSTVFELDLTHRLTLNCENNAILARITWSVLDVIQTPDAQLCTRVKIFISRNISKISNSLKQHLQYDLYLQLQDSRDVSEDSRVCFSPFQIWFADEIHDPESPITREHINHARLCIALVTVCGKALREMLLNNFQVPYRDIYQVILANQAKLTKKGSEHRLDDVQIKLVFPSPEKTGTVELFDISLLCKLIRVVSIVQVPKPGRKNDPDPLDTSLGASVVRIRKYRNQISGHSPDATIDDKDFKDYWKKFEDVLRDIETVINSNVYSKELDRQKRQVISIFDAY